MSDLAHADFLTVSLTFLCLVMLGVLIGYAVSKKIQSYAGKYITLLAAPTIGVVVLWQMFGNQIVFLYLLSALIGFILEYQLGHSYQKFVGRPLWVYDATAYSIGQHTSLLTLPMWGVAGIVFWLIAKVLGL